MDFLRSCRKIFMKKFNKNPEGMRQRELHMILGTAFLVTVVILEMTSWRLREGIRNEVLAQRRLSWCQELSRQLLEASDALTDQVRRFAVTGDRRYMDQYWDELLVTKRQDEAVERLLETGLEKGEETLLLDARNNSEYLSYMEIRAMKLAALGEGILPEDMPGKVRAYVLNVEEAQMTREEKTRQAQKLLFDDAYTFEKETINGRIRRFQQVLGERLEREMEASRNRTDWLIRLQAVLLIAAAAILFLAFWIFYCCFSRPICHYSEALMRLQEKECLERQEGDGQVLQPEGTFEMRLFAETFNRTLGKLREASRAKSQFVARMSHEIRTPLTTVLGYQYLLGRTPLTGKQKEYVENMGYAGNCLMQVVNQILDFSKLSRDGGGAENGSASGTSLADAGEWFSLGQLLTGLQAMFWYEAEKKGLYFRLENRIGEREWIFGDRDRLRQILVNLIGNGIKFTERGGLRLEAWTEGASGSMVCFAVCDTGKGIGKDKQEVIFRPFEQEDASIGQSYGGTGLGLPISRMLAEQMGGSLTVSSRPGEGSVFTLKLPVSLRKPDGAYEAGVPDAGEPEAYVDGKRDAGGPKAYADGEPDRGRLGRYPGRRVLLAEDHEINRRMEAEILECLGICPDTASSGAEAVRMAVSGEYELLLLDYYLGDMTGIDVIRAVRQAREKNGMKMGVCAILTADGDGEHVRQILREAEFYLSKPLSVEALDKLFCRVFGQERQEGSGYSAAEARLEKELTVMEDLFPLRHEADLKLLAGYTASGQWQQVRRLCHMLIGVCGTLKWTDMAEYAGLLDQEAKAERPDRERAKIYCGKLWELYEAGKNSRKLRKAGLEAGASAAQNAGRETAEAGAAMGKAGRETAEAAAAVERAGREDEEAAAVFLERLRKSDFESVELFSRQEDFWKRHLTPEEFRKLSECMMRFDLEGAADLIDGSPKLREWEKEMWEQ